MKAKKYLIADTVIILVFAVLLLAAGLYFLINTDPFAFMTDGTLDNTGIAGLILIFFLGIPALIAKLLMYLWIAYGVIFLLFGIVLGILALTLKEHNGLYAVLCVYIVFAFMLLSLTFVILLVAVAIVSSSESPGIAFILAEFMHATFDVGLLSAVFSIITMKELKKKK